MRRGQHFADEHPHRGAGWAEAGQHQHEDRHDPHAHLYEQVDREGLIGAMRLQEPAVEGQQDEEGGSGQDRRDADAALLVEDHGDTVPTGEHQDGPRQDEHAALPVHAAGPAPDQVAAAVLVPHRHPTHDGDDNRGPRHGEDQVQPRELIEDAVAVRRQHPGQGDGENDAGPVGQHPGRGQRARLQEAGPQRLDARPGLGIEDELGPQIRPYRVGRQRHGRRHALDDDFGRRRVGGLRPAHTRALAAVVSSSMPIRSICGRICRCTSSPPAMLTWMPSDDRTATPPTVSV